MIRLLFLLGLTTGLLQGEGLAPRVASTTLNLPQQPVTESSNYALVNAFPGENFTQPVAMVTPDGETNRLFIVGQRGVVWEIPDLRDPDPRVWLDIQGRVDHSSNEEGLLGMAFHPKFASNGTFFVFYTGAPTLGGGRDDILSRFQVQTNGFGDASSEVKLFSQWDQASNHNGADLHFGPDGYLYIGLGDEGDANDTRNNSQRIDKDFYAGMFRIDVDRRPENLEPNGHVSVVLHNNVAAYKIPFDNPWVGATSFNGIAVDTNKVVTEFYAVGLRNPWRFSFDRMTGRLYCADVGQNRYEFIHLIEKGGNYGWAFREGFHAGPKTAPAGAVAIDPILEYPHGSGAFQGNSITGGFVYRGERFPDLVGHYIFADYVSGNLWSCLYDGTNCVSWVRLEDENGTSAIYPDPRNGDILVADRDQHLIRRLSGEVTSNVPQTLADAGVFSDLENLTPHAGIEPYEIAVPFWSDGAIKSRWFTLPDTNTVMGFEATDNWAFPSGAVWVKHFEMEMTNGVAASRRRLETRLLVKTDDGAYGLTYRWGGSSTDAVLVPSVGQNEPLQIHDDGMIQDFTWRYPSQAECLQCHTPAAGYVLGFRTAQMNLAISCPGGMTNQIQALAARGYFDASPPPLHTLTRLAPPDDTSLSLTWRARSWLQANCANCHIPGGPVQGHWNADITVPLTESGIIDGPLFNILGEPTNRVLARGDADHSMLLQRIASRGIPTTMPPVGSNRIDPTGVALISDWIQQLSSYQTFAEWQVAEFGSTNAVEAAADADPDLDRGRNDFEFLTGSNPRLADGLWDFDLTRSDGSLSVQYEHLADIGFELQSTTNLLSSVWQFEAHGDFSASNQMQVITISTNLPAAYYRFRLTAP